MTPMNRQQIARDGLTIPLVRDMITIIAVMGIQ